MQLVTKFSLQFDAVRIALNATNENYVAVAGPRDCSVIVFLPGSDFVAQQVTVDLGLGSDADGAPAAPAPSGPAGKRGSVAVRLRALCRYIDLPFFRIPYVPTALICCGTVSINSCEMQWRSGGLGRGC